MKTPAVIIPGDRTATLGIARSLGRKGITVYGVDPDSNAIGMVSKYVRPITIPNGEDTEDTRLQVLIELGKKLEEKAVLFPVSDADVILCSKERNQLEKYFLFVMPNHETVTKLITKDGLRKVAERFGIPSPKIFHLGEESDISGISTELTYPVILKPIYSTSWSNQEIISLLQDHPLSNPPKVALCKNKEELQIKYQKISIFDPRIIIQEVIPGEDQRLYYVCFYFDRHSRPLALFAGQKLRILPVGFGSATYVRSIKDEELEDISLKFLQSTQYKGLGGVEFKKDPRDNQYKLIEFNARFGLWDSLSVECGMDIPYIAYCDAINIPVESQQDYRTGILWVDFERDMRAFLIYRSRGLLSFWDWIKSFQGEVKWSVFSRYDMKPSLISIFSLLNRIKSKILKSN